MAWRIAESLEVLRKQFNDRYPNRSKLSDGGIGDAAHASRSSDHNPWYQKGGMGVVTARDFTHDPANGMDIDRLTDELAASRDPRIKYIIANGLILDSRPGNNPWRWMPYHGVNKHTKHFHLSVMPELCDDARPWNLPSFGGAAPTPAPAPAPIHVPGGIEEMAFTDSYEDWAGNRQSVKSWMDNVDQRIAGIHHMLFAPGSEASRIPGDENRTNGRDALMDTTAKSAITYAMVQDLHRKVDALETGGVDVNALADRVAQILAPGIAKAVSDEIAKRMAS
jgi:hypothetical protein